MMKGLIFVFLFFSKVLIAQDLQMDSIRQSIRHLPPGKQVDHLYTVAAEYANSNLPVAKSIASKGLADAMVIKDHPQILKGYLLLADIAVRQPNLRLADSLYALVISNANPSIDSRWIVKARLGQAKNLGLRGMPKEELQKLEEAAQLAMTTGDSLMLAKVWMGLGINAEHRSDFEAALEWYYKTLRVHEAQKNEFSAGIAHTNIGMTLLKLHHYKEALEQFKIAYATSQQLDDTEGLMINALNIGAAFQRLQQPEEAVTWFDSSMTIARSMGSWYDIALITSNKGNIQKDKGDFAAALPLLERALHLQDSLDLQFDKPYTYNSLAEVYLGLNQYKPAAEMAARAQKLSLDYNRLDQLSSSYRIQSTINAVQGNYTNAYKAFMNHKHISDSIFNIERDKAISNLKLKYESTQKENKILHLTEENERRRMTQWIYLGIGSLVLLTGMSVFYSMYLRQRHDKRILQKERELHALQNQFFTNISHEFRTPLTLIQGPAHTLSQKWNGTPDGEKLSGIEKNAERLHLLINQILDLTRFDMKLLELKRENFNLSLLIRSVCSSFDSMAGDREIQYTYDIPDNLYMHGDARRIEIILINLISNAYKYTPNLGKIEVSVQFDKAGGRSMVQVRDTGVGIPVENIKSVFDRFYHDDRQSQVAVEGMGIGLALSKYIAEMHGGSISVTSGVDQGSTFSVWLPGTYLNEELVTTTHGLPDPVSLSGDVHADEKSPLILIVDDRKDMRDYVTSLLEHSYKVVRCANASEGMNASLEYIPDVIISDVMMPGKSGLEFCRDIKTDIRTSHIPVILLTARSATEDRISGLETEADVYLTKPFIPEELELHLRNLISSRRKISALYQQLRRIEPAKMSFNSLDEQFLQEVQSQLEANYKEETFSVEKLADLMHLSRSQLHRKLQYLTGQPPNKVIRTFRLQRGKEMIESKSGSIGEIAYSVGFGSPAYFTKCFSEEFGSPPGILMP